MGLQKVFDLPTWIRNLDSPSTFTRRYLQYPYRKTYWRQQSKFLFAYQNSLGTFFTVLFTNQQGEPTKLFVLWGHWKVTGNFSLEVRNLSLSLKEQITKERITTFLSDLNRYEICNTTESEGVVYLDVPMIVIVQSKSSLRSQPLWVFSH